MRRHQAFALAAVGRWSSLSDTGPDAVALFSFFGVLFILAFRAAALALGCLIFNSSTHEHRALR
jgi:hypothetical protein